MFIRLIPEDHLLQCRFFRQEDTRKGSGEIKCSYILPQSPLKIKHYFHIFANFFKFKNRHTAKCGAFVQTPQYL